MLERLYNTVWVLVELVCMYVEIHQDTHLRFIHGKTSVTKHYVSISNSSLMMKTVYVCVRACVCSMYVVFYFCTSGAQP